MQFTSKSTIHFSIFFDFSPPPLLLLSISLPYLLRLRFSAFLLTATHAFDPENLRRCTELCQKPVILFATQVFCPISLRRDYLVYIDIDIPNAKGSSSPMLQVPTTAFSRFFFESPSISTLLLFTR